MLVWLRLLLLLLTTGRGTALKTMSILNHRSQGRKEPIIYWVSLAHFRRRELDIIGVTLLLL